MRATPRPRGPTTRFPCQFSSLSSPTKPLAVLKAAFHAPKRLCPSPPEVDLSMVWPTAEEVCASVEGYGAGGALPSAQKNVDKAPREMLCRWTKDGSSDFVTARRRAMPHIKTWTRVSGDGSTVRWSILTSANLSGGAWGNVRDGGRTLFIMHWELGVLVTPSILGAPLRTTQGSEGAIVPLALSRARRGPTLKGARAVLVGGALRDARPLGQARHEADCKSEHKIRN